MSNYLLAPSSFALDALRDKTLVFWDFDGVIKESVEIKGEAFEALFRPYGPTVAARVRAHHRAHGGVSRFEKLPIYLSWAGQPTTPEAVAACGERFSALVREAVIAAAWVPGAHEYLLQNHARQQFVLVTATPHDEIKEIVEALDLTQCFSEIVGSPTDKSAAVAAALARTHESPASCIYIGDSETDLAAARANRVPFLLRRTPLNVELQTRYDGAAFDDFAS
jgi:phosphoglycolate phosphatase-like HAD superfamily hydrolase